MRTLHFHKYSGNGNDFIIIPETDLSGKEISQLCDRHFGVGADGVLTISSEEGVDARMRIFNADGGEAEMCANGLRCLATYVDQLTKTRKTSYKIRTMNGEYEVFRRDTGMAIEMSEIREKNLYDLSAFTEFERSFFVNTGVPHLVFLSADNLKLNLKETAPKYRFHSIFPRGTNVNFVTIRGAQEAYVRTYERGVEDETYSCGTGLTATALALSHWFHWKNTVTLFTKGGKQTVEVGEKVFYSGEVKLCFVGETFL